MKELPERIKNHVKPIIQRHLYEGKKMDFYAALTQYDDELRLTFLTVNKQTEYLAGIYSIPLQAFPELLGFLQDVFIYIAATQEAAKHEAKKNE